MTIQPSNKMPIPRGTRGGLDVDAQEGLDIGTLINSLKRQQWLIFFCVVLSCLVALIVLRNSQPSYFSSVEILLDTKQERIVGVERIVSDLNVSNSTVAGEVAVLQSNILLGRVVDDLDLINHPDFDPYKVEPPGILGRAAETVKLGLASVGLLAKAPEPMPSTASDTSDGLTAQGARNLVIWQLRRDLNVFQSGISYVITVTVRANDAALAADLANAVANRYIQDQLDDKLMATQRAIDWLDERVGQLEDALRAAEDLVVEFRAGQVRDQGGNAEGVLQQLRQLNDSVVLARNDRASAESTLMQVNRLLAEGGPDAAAAALNTPRIVALDGELAALQRQRAQLATRLGPRHPEMRALELALNDLGRDRSDAIAKAILEREATVAAAKERQLAIAADIDATLDRQLELSRSSVRLSQLERSASATRQVYESFLNRFQETTQQLEFQRPDARLITEGQPPLTPARPRKKLVMIAALILGAALGVAVALVREAMDRSIRDRTSLGRVANLPVLAALPRQVRRLSLLTFLTFGRWQPKLFSYAEALRLLRFSLTKEAGSQQKRVIMMTGVEWDVGCSATVQGLALVLAAVGQRVAVIDANFRRPKQGIVWEVPAHARRIDAYLTGKATLREVIKGHKVASNVTVFAARHASANAADMLTGSRFRTLIEQVSASHDTVLIDAPPAIGIADTTLVAEISDINVIVVRCHQTKSQTVLAAIAAIEASGARVSGAVLTDAEEDASTHVTQTKASESVLRGETVDGLVNV